MSTLGPSRDLSALALAFSEESTRDEALTIINQIGVASRAFKLAREMAEERLLDWVAANGPIEMETDGDTVRWGRVERNAKWERCSGIDARSLLRKHMELEGGLGAILEQAGGSVEDAEAVLVDLLSGLLSANGFKPGASRKRMGDDAARFWFKKPGSIGFGQLKPGKTTPQAKPKTAAVNNGDDDDDNEIYF